MEQPKADTIEIYGLTIPVLRIDAVKSRAELVSLLGLAEHDVSIAVCRMGLLRSAKVSTAIQGQGYQVSQIEENPGLSYLQLIRLLSSKPETIIFQTRPTFIICVDTNNRDEMLQVKRLIEWIDFANNQALSTPPKIVIIDGKEEDHGY